MKNLDLEKVIIILSLVLMPVAGGWIYMLDKELQEADVAFRNCDKVISEIHGLHEVITKTKEVFENQGDTIDDPRAYFRNRAINSQKTKQGALYLKAEDITVRQRSKTKVRAKGGVGKEIGEDIEIRIEFGKGKRGGLPLPRGFINAFIFNCEMRLPVWKLRQLKITNKDFKSRGQAVPPLEMADEWIVNEMIFARRKPLDSKG